MAAAGVRKLNPIIAVTIVLWVTAYAGLYGMAIASGARGLDQLLLVRLGTCAVGALLCGWLYVTLRPLRTYPFWLQAVVALVATMIAAALWTLLDQAIQQSAGYTGPPDIFIFLRRNFGVFHWACWIYLTWCLVYVSIEYRNSLVSREVDLARVRTAALDAQNRMLRYQLNPHFLFNTLNALSALVLDDKRDQAEHVLMALSRFLRYSLEQDPIEKTILAEEIAAQEEYMAIEQIRFGDKLRYIKSIEPAALDALVPCFILQPAVENAIKYAVSPSSHPVTLELKAFVQGNNLVLMVRDDGMHGTTAKWVGLGVGLDNVKRRLALIYGSAATMKAHKMDQAGFQVEVTLPLERVSERPAQQAKLAHA